MNNTTPKPKSQLSPDQSMAALAHATMLSEQMMPKVDPAMAQDPQNADNSPQNGTGQAQPEKPEETAPKEEKPKNEEIKEDMEKMVEDKVRQVLKEILDE